jgi:ribulose-5-phosphate 4-epimerase/fuculose-1-phosphate aldolase
MVAGMGRCGFLAVESIVEPAGGLEKMMNVRKEVSDAEWGARQDLAAFYRLVAGYGWDDLLLAHLSCRVPGEEAYLINPFGLLFEEITASSLLKVDYRGQKLMESDYEISPEANVIHGAILTARQDVCCVAHVHTVAGTAVASRVEGLRNVSQQSMIVAASLAYHDYEGVVLDPAEAPRLQADLGEARHMILRNHGLLTVGPCVSQTFQALYNLQRACEIQIAAEAGDPPLIPISEKIVEKAVAMFGSASAGPSADLLWAALLRRLDRTQPDFRQ